MPLPPASRFHSPALAGEKLRGGAVVAFPTETFFGLAAIPTSTQAVELLCEMKGRELGAGVPLIAASSSVIEAFLDPEESSVREQRKALQHHFWPGPLTLVCSARKAKGLIHQSIFGPEDTLAFRVSSRREASELAEHAGGLITATSANLKGKAPSRRSDEVAEYFPDLGILEEYEEFQPHSQPSTILDIRRRELRILREGAVSADSLAKVF